MLTLLHHELRKHLTRFTLIFTSVMLLLNLAVVFLQYMDQLNPENTMIREAQEALLEDYTNDRDTYDADYADYEERLKEYKSAVSARSYSGVWTQIEFNNQKIDLKRYGDQQLYQDVDEIITRTEGYNRTIEKVLKSSYSKIREIGILPGNYVYEYQVALISHYTPLAELDIPTEPVRGWEEFFTLKTPVIFQTVTILGIFVSIFITEKRVRSLNILHISKKGGSPLIGAKLLTAGIYSLILTLLFTLTPMLILAVTTGFTTPHQYVQATAALHLCPYELTMGQYLLLLIGVKIVVFFVLSLVIAVLGQLVGSELIVLSSGAVFMVLSYLLSTVTDTASPLFEMRRFNFFDAAFGTFYFERYRALNLFGNHIALIPFTAVVLIMITAAVLAVSFIVGFRSRLLTAQPKQSRKKAEKVRKQKKSAPIRTGSMSILGYEFTKNLLNPKGMCIIAAALAVKIVVSAVTFMPVETNSELIYRDYILDLKGTVTEAQDAYIDEENSYISKSLADYARAEVDYREKTIGYEEFRTFTERKNYAELVEKPFERVIERQMYVKRAQSAEEGFENIEYIYEEGLKQFLFSFFDVVLVMLCLALLSDLFSREYQSGFIMILSLTKYGGRRTFLAKYLFGFITVSVLYLLFTAVDLVMLTKNYDMYYLASGLMSAPDLWSLGWNLSVGEYMVLYKAISYIGFLLTGCMMISISLLTKNVLISAIVSLGIAFIPAFVGFFGVDAIGWIDLTAVLNPSMVKEILPQSVILVIGCAVLFVLARRKWVKK